jgi:density-regulated protein DRP1
MYKYLRYFHPIISIPSFNQPTMASTNTLTARHKPLYCSACGMPPEYCEYGPDFETHCAPWLKVHHADLFARLHGDKQVAGGAASAASSKPPAPTEPWTTRQRLTAFYTKYMPEKLDGIDAILDKYAGKEDKLFAALVQKYGPEPEDPYIIAKYGAASDDEDDDNEAATATAMDKLEISVDKKKRRGAAAKTTTKQDTRIILQKISRNRKKAVTHIVGMDTVPDINLKDAAKAFSKRFAGSSSVKDKEIIIQGDHLEECADMIVKKFGVKKECVFLDLDGEFVPFAEF